MVVEGGLQRAQNACTSVMFAMKPLPSTKSSAQTSVSVTALNECDMADSPKGCKHCAVVDDLRQNVYDCKPALTTGGPGVITRHTPADQQLQPKPLIAPCMHSACFKGASRLSSKIMKLFGDLKQGCPSNGFVPARSCVTSCSMNSSRTQVQHQAAQTACTGPPLSPRRVKALSHLSRRSLLMVTGVGAASQQLGESQQQQLSHTAGLGYC